MPSPRRPSWTDDERALDLRAEAGLVLEEGMVLAGKYRLERRAGFGGMAELWVARNEATAAEVCVKVLVPQADAEDDAESVQRFRREAYAGARLSHRAIVRVFDLLELGPTGELAGGGRLAGLAIVMELLHGETLGDLVAAKGKLSVDEALDVALPFVSALAHAHRAGVVHRDLKPDNIFLARDPDGHVTPKVLDFGVSKVAGARSLTNDGVMLGTPTFMSPEQARGASNVDARSDVFSAGIVVYLMLAGQNPFEDASFHSVLSAIMEREPARPPGVPDELWGVLDKALRKDPSERYADAGELGIALGRAAGRASPTDSWVGPARIPFDSVATVPPVGSTSVAPPEQESEPALAIPMTRRRLLPVVAGALAVAAGVVLAAWPLSSSPRGDHASASPPPAPAPTAAVVPASASPADAAPSVKSAPSAKSARPHASAKSAEPHASAKSARPHASATKKSAKSATSVKTARPGAGPAKETPPAKTPPAATEIARDPGF